MINAVIIDDEQNNIDNLTILLQQYCPQVKLVASAANADGGEKIIVQYNPDLIFLDIQMPGKNGFDLLQSLPRHDFEIIFVTAYDKYGIQAIKFSAIDYLLKPVNTDELKKAVDKATERSHFKKQNLQLENLIQLLYRQQSREEHRIALAAGQETRFIQPKYIIRCESSNNYSTFYFQSGEKIIVSKPIYEYEELLTGYGFIRCHQSHLVNKRFIKSWVKGDGGYLLLEDQTQIPVSRQKKDQIKEMLSKTG